MSVINSWRLFGYKEAELASILQRQKPKISWKNVVHPTWEKIYRTSNWKWINIADEIVSLMRSMN